MLQFVMILVLVILSSGLGIKTIVLMADTPLLMETIAQTCIQ